MRATLVLYFLLGFTATAFASSDAGKPLPAITLQEAVARTLANNLGIKAAIIDVDVEKARRNAGSLSMPYRLDAEIENIGGTDSVSGFDSSETTLQLSRVLELGDKRQYRTDLGDAQVELARTQVSVQELQLAAEVSRRYAALLRRQEQINLIAGSVAIGGRTLEIVQRRVAVGRASEAEQSSAAVALARTQLIGKRLQFELAAARVDLSTLWGSMHPDFVRVAGNIGSLPSLPNYPDLQARLANNPELRRIATNGRVLSARRQLAEARRRPDVELSAGVRHLAATDDVAMVFSFSMPFGSSGRAEPLINAADMEIAKLPVTRNDRLLNVQSALFGFYQTLLAMHGELDVLQIEIIPEAERAVQFYERGFELGSNSLLELTAAQERLLGVRGEAQNAAATFHLTLIEIESLLGGSSPGGALQ
jgi:cobalt-zinc-cadmium efflux system outer membrane protein